MFHPVIPHTMKDLEELGTPGPAVSDGMESLTAKLYHVVEFTSASTTNLTFFTVADTNNGFTTNMKQAGQLPNPDFFMLYGVTLDVIAAGPGDNARLADMYAIINGSGTTTAVPWAKFHYASKSYGPYPLSAIPAEGGQSGFSTRTAVEYANNGVPGRWLSMGQGPGGDAAIEILPLQAFSWELRWPNTVTLSNNVGLLLTMHGTYYRQIR